MHLGKFMALDCVEWSVVRCVFVVKESSHFGHNGFACPASRAQPNAQHAGAHTVYCDEDTCAVSTSCVLAAVAVFSLSPLELEQHRLMHRITKSGSASISISHDTHPARGSNSNQQGKLSHGAIRAKPHVGGCTTPNTDSNSSAGYAKDHIATSKANCPAFPRTRQFALRYHLHYRE